MLWHRQPEEAVLQPAQGQAQDFRLRRGRYAAGPGEDHRPPDRRLAEEQITLAELAEEFGVSRERVRQIEVSAVEKVQKAVENRVAEIEAPATLTRLP
jgi:hypothetical protein